VAQLFSLGSIARHEYLPTLQSTSEPAAIGFDDTTASVSLQSLRRSFIASAEAQHQSSHYYLWRDCGVRDCFAQLGRSIDECMFCRALFRCRRRLDVVIHAVTAGLVMTMLPNKSPEPTPVGAGSSASRFTVAGPAWLSFFR
jgi:hypothetical protein